jgi:sortase A
VNLFRKRPPSRLLAQGLLALGVLLVATSAYNLTLGDQASEQAQQARAEAVPLVVSPSSTANSSPLKEGEVFAKLSAPRLGQDYLREIAEGTSLDRVLNTVGLGHYVNTQMPGEVGNFAIAGHRAGNGGPMRNIDKFTDGDLVYVETADKKFTYKYLETKIVAPSEIGVINPVPTGLSKKSEPGKYLTLTSCTPIYVNTNRIIVWFEQVAEQPR